MRRFFFSLLLLITMFLFGLSFVGQTQILAADRFAACDLCGYCPPDNPPSTWQKCIECLYPVVANSNPDPAVKATLRVDTTTNTGPTPYQGRHYTVIG